MLVLFGGLVHSGYKRAKDAARETLILAYEGCEGLLYPLGQILGALTRLRVNWLSKMCP